MGTLIACAVGVTLLVIEILIQEFNDGGHTNLTSWMTGVYFTLGIVQYIERSHLAFVLCCLPSLSILIVKLVRRFSHAERV